MPTAPVPYNAPRKAVMTLIAPVRATMKKAIPLICKKHSSHEPIVLQQVLPRYNQTVEKAY